MKHFKLTLLSSTFALGLAFQTSGLYAAGGEEGDRPLKGVVHSARASAQGQQGQRTPQDDSGMNVDQLKSYVATLESENDRMRKATRRANELIPQLLERLEAKKNTLIADAEKARQAQVQQENLVKELHEAHAKATAGLTEQIGAAQREAQAAKDALSGVEAQRAEFESQVKDLQAKVAAASGQDNELSTLLEKAEQDLQESRKALREKIQDQHKAQQVHAEALQAEKDAHAADLRAAQAEKEELAQQLTTAQQQAREAVQKAEEAAQAQVKESTALKAQVEDLRKQLAEAQKNAVDADALKTLKDAQLDLTAKLDKAAADLKMAQDNSAREIDRLKAAAEKSAQELKVVRATLDAGEIALASKDKLIARLRAEKSNESATPAAPSTPLAASTPVTSGAARAGNNDAAASASPTLQLGNGSVSGVNILDSIDLGDKNNNDNLDASAAGPVPAEESENSPVSSTTSLNEDSKAGSGAAPGSTATPEKGAASNSGQGTSDVAAAASASAVVAQPSTSGLDDGATERQPQTPGKAFVAGVSSPVTEKGLFRNPTLTGFIGGAASVIKQNLGQDKLDRLVNFESRTKQLGKSKEEKDLKKLRDATRPVVKSVWEVDQKVQKLKQQAGQTSTPAQSEVLSRAEEELKVALKALDEHISKLA